MDWLLSQCLSHLVTISNFAHTRTQKVNQNNTHKYRHTTNGTGRICAGASLASFARRRPLKGKRIKTPHKLLHVVQGSTQHCLEKSVSILGYIQEFYERPEDDVNEIKDFPE